MPHQYGESNHVGADAAIAVADDVDPRPLQCNELVVHLKEHQLRQPHLLCWFARNQTQELQDSRARLLDHHSQRQRQSMMKTEMTSATNPTITTISSSDGHHTHDEPIVVTRIIKPTPKRWLILVLFSMNSFNKALQWIQVSAATNKATEFYQVEHWTINLTSVIFQVSFLFMSWPACLAVDKIGLRSVVVLSSCGASAGAIIKYLSCSLSFGLGREPGDAEAGANIYLLLLGCLLVSMSEQIIFSVPSRLVAVWFPDHQVSLAQSICIQWNLTGVAVGFLVTPLMLRGAETRLEMGARFREIFLWTAVLSVSLFLLNYLFLDEAPEHAPGQARSKQIERERQLEDDTHKSSLASRLRTMLAQVVQLTRNRDLMLVAVSYGIAFARTDTLLTLVDQTIGQVFTNDDHDDNQVDSAQTVSWTGCLLILAGAFGSPFWGRILDKWRAYKRVTMLLFVTTSLSLALFVYAITQLKWVPGVYLTAALFGFFQTGFFVAGLELALELTYPAPELITTSLLNVMPSFFGPFFTLISSYIVDNHGVVATSLFYFGSLVVGFLCTVCVNEQLKRQDALQTQPGTTPPPQDSVVTTTHFEEVGRSVPA